MCVYLYVWGVSSIWQPVKGLDFITLNLHHLHPPLPLLPPNLLYCCIPSCYCHWQGAELRTISNQQSVPSTLSFSSTVSSLFLWTSMNDSTFNGLIGGHGSWSAVALLHYAFLLSVALTSFFFWCIYEKKSSHVSLVHTSFCHSHCKLLQLLHCELVFTVRSGVKAE